MKTREQKRTRREKAARRRDALVRSWRLYWLGYRVRKLKDAKRLAASTARRWSCMEFK
jgi:hypothetical protein